MKQLYGGIDLHANNSVIALVDEWDNVVWEKRFTVRYRVDIIRNYDIIENS
jgi:hypothetical protein